MKKFFVICTLMFGSSSFGSVLSCGEVFVDGLIQDRTHAYVDDENALLRVVGPSGNISILTEEQVYPYDSPAIWYDRSSECSVVTTRPEDGSTKHLFVCKSAEGVNTDAALEISADRRTSKYSGIISIAGVPDQNFSAEFKACK